MGFLDKIKGAVNAVTGGAATVTIQYTENAQAGKAVPIKVTATSKGGEVKSKGIFVDFIGGRRAPQRSATPFRARQGRAN